MALLGTLIDDEFGDDGDSFEGFIPAYNVWDLTAEFRFWKGRAGVFAGIRNVFDEDYWGEVREEGIMPALPRNYYGGLAVRFPSGGSSAGTPKPLSAPRSRTGRIQTRVCP